MSLLSSLQDGIKSATYNPEYEKAKEQEKESLEQAKQSLIHTIDSLKKSIVPQKPYYKANVSTLVTNAEKWVSDNRSATVDQFQSKNREIQYEASKYAPVDDQLKYVAETMKLLKASADDKFQKKQLDATKKKAIDALLLEYNTWAKSMPVQKLNATAPDVILQKTNDWIPKANAFLEGMNIRPLALPTNPVDEKRNQDRILQTEKEAKKTQKAAEQNFSTTRLTSEILRITMQTVLSLLIVVLFLVSGMLAANDAIGRDWRYRVLYFFYGGIGFPIMLTYYLYRWFIGTAPTIYRMLPIFTEEADTPLGRFFFFPFTYVEDDAARKAKADFLQKAAELVSKKYKAGVDAKDTMTGVVKAMEALGVTKESAEIATSGAEIVTAALENVVDKMKGLELKQSA